MPESEKQKNGQDFKTKVPVKSVPTEFKKIAVTEWRSRGKAGKVLYPIWLVNTGFMWLLLVLWLLMAMFAEGHLRQSGAWIDGFWAVRPENYVEYPEGDEGVFQ